jgi:hypothetical protein
VNYFFIQHLFIFIITIFLGKYYNNNLFYFQISKKIFELKEKNFKGFINNHQPNSKILIIDIKTSPFLYITNKNYERHTYRL